MSEDRFKELGLKVGLELHQQLDTSRKLYCHCPTTLRDDEPDGGFIRRLRPTRSEMGEVDQAALFEFQKGKKYYYEYYNDTTCLVEADEEPPHDLCEESIDICLTIAKFLESSPIDEVHSMRKTVIDGSNTTGFQRTAIVTLGGKLQVEGKTIGIQAISLEEDAARKIAEDNKRNTVTYRLDRLGIPLIEIATDPDIRTPSQAEDVALALGLLLRSTGKVKRGIGTIRQDVNVSIKGGAITEIKGLQQLDLLSSVVEYEALRQERLLKIRDELLHRGINPDMIEDEPADVSDIFVETESKVIKQVLNSGGFVFAVKLPGFASLVGREIQPERRLGTELSDYAQFWSGVGGIFHTDELPKYGISESDVLKLRTATAAEEKDAVIIVAATQNKCKKALTAVIERARESVQGIPHETRTPLSDGTTKFARPRPGAKRMYPETDVRPVKITAERLKRIAKNMPETLDTKEKRFLKEYDLSEELASQLVRSLQLDLFENLVNNTGASPTIIAVTLENTLVNLNRDNIPTENLTEQHFQELFKSISNNEITPEAIPVILTHLSNNPKSNLQEALSATGLSRVSSQNLEEIVKSIVEEKIDFVKERREGAIDGLMGIAMKQLRGRADGKTIKELLIAEIHKILDE
ncbi:MAG: Glu-tRNA(Gln) amidotransferase subunit GatE [Candidatus Thorarchaeota archaeon]